MCFDERNTLRRGRSAVPTIFLRTRCRFRSRVTVNRFCAFIVPYPINLTWRHWQTTCLPYGEQLRFRSECPYPCTVPACGTPEPLQQTGRLSAYRRREPE